MLMFDGLKLTDVSSGYLLFLSAYHVWSGGISFFAPSFALRFYRAAYGCEPTERRHLLLILRPWGALAIFAGLAGFVAFFVTEARVWIVGALVVLLLLRVGYRVGLSRELRELSGITPKRNTISVACLMVGVVLLGTELLVGWAA
jgi:hypothetical protein